jgi:hypothetical protein
LNHWDLQIQDLCQKMPIISEITPVYYQSKIDYSMFEKLLQKLKFGSCKPKVSDDVNAFKESDKKQDTTNTDTKKETQE